MRKFSANVCEMLIAISEMVEYVLKDSRSKAKIYCTQPNAEYMVKCCVLLEFSSANVCQSRRSLNLYTTHFISHSESAPKSCCIIIIIFFSALKYCTRANVFTHTDMSPEIYDWCAIRGHLLNHHRKNNRNMCCCCSLNAKT